MNPKALSGMTTGSVIMFLFGALWLFVGFLGGRFFPAWMRVGLPVVGLALAVWIVVLAVRSARISRNAPPPTAEQTAIGRQIGRRFGWINGIQGGAIFLVIVALNGTHRPDFIVAVIAVIVGLHFLPLAGLFQRPAYYVTGLLGCVIGVAGFLISDPSTRQSAVGLSFGLLLWLTVASVVSSAFSLRGE